MTNEEYGIILEDSQWVYPYVKAVMDFCTIQDPESGSIIPIVYPPERAFADKTSEVTVRGVRTKQDTLPLPYMSLVLQDLVFDPERYQGARFRKLQYTSDRNMVYGSRYPEPYTYVFQLDIRHRNNLEWYRILKAFHLGRIFKSAAHIQIPMGAFGSQLHRIDIEGPVDNSDLEAGDNRDRALRKTYTLNVQGWLLAGPIERTPSVKYTNIEFKENTIDGLSYGSVITDYLDNVTITDPE